jgi:hypothetical protein
VTATDNSCNDPGGEGVVNEVIDPILTGGVSAGAILAALVWLGKRFLATLERSNDKLAIAVNQKDQAYRELTERFLTTIGDVQSRSQQALSDNTIALARVAEQQVLVAKHLDELSKEGCKPLLEAVRLLEQQTKENER